MTKREKTFVVIEEAFRSIHLSEDNLIELSEAQAFLHLFCDVKDFRQAGKVTFPLPDLLLLIFLTMLREKTDCFLQIAASIDVNKKSYQAYGLIQGDQVPSHDTVRRVMMYLSKETLLNVLLEKIYAFLRQLEEEIPSKDRKYRQTSIDGKEVRGTGRSAATLNPKGNFSFLNVYDNDLKTCIYSEFVDKKTNEIPVFQEIGQCLNFKKTS